MDYSLIKLKEHGDKKGLLISLEENRNIPFEIKRVFYIYGTLDGVTRGKHAHKSLKQFAICTSGKCKFLLDDGIKKEIVELASPDDGLYIGNLIWREMFDFSSDCVLLVFANEYYDTEEYIKSYDEFKRIILKKEQLAV